MRPDSLEAPVAPVLGTPRRSRDRARITVVAAIAVVVLGGGIGLAGNGFTSPPASPSVSATTGPTASPTAPVATLPGPTPRFPPPTPNTGLGCAPVRLGTPPEIRLGSVPGDPLAIRGVPPGNVPGDPASQPPTWPVLPAASALRMSARSSVQLISEEDACMRYVIAEYQPGAAGVTIPFPISFRTLNVNPPRSIVPLGVLPAGDWLVRVVAYFFTGTAGQEDGTVVERFFRVANSETAVPLPTPVTSPGVPCTPPPPGGVPPTLVLSGSGSALVEGTPGLVVPSIAPVQLGDLIEIRVAGDACAIAWTIGATQPEVSNQYDIEREDNTDNNPFLYAQNRWRLHDLPTGLLFVTAAVRFSADLRVTSRWLLDVRGADLPAARIVAPNGAQVTAAHAPCGASWTFASGTGGYEYCTEEAIPATVPTLTVAPETPLRVDVPGWTTISWGGNCGRAGAPNGAAGLFLIVNNCDLGGRYPNDGSPAPGPAIFLPRSAAPLVRIYLQVSRGDTVVTMLVFAMIETGS
ncbi:MAG: hypothetical protein V4515_14100 [Chloroflexota bacterium]